MLTNIKVSLDLQSEYNRRGHCAFYDNAWVGVTTFILVLESFKLKILYNFVIITLQLFLFNIDPQKNIIVKL